MRQRQQQARRAAKRASEGPKPKVARWGPPRLLDESNFPSKPLPKRPPRPEPAEPAGPPPEERGVAEATTAQTASLLTVRPEGSRSPPASAAEARRVRLGVDGPPAAVSRWPPADYTVRPTGGANNLLLLSRASYSAPSSYAHLDGHH